MEEQYLAQRNVMLERQIKARGGISGPVIEAMGSVAREAFVPVGLRKAAYRDCALPIGEGQTISQPFVVALMNEALSLTGGERVLEIGTGSGYGAAVLSRIAGEVHTIERIALLAERAATILRTHEHDNVSIHVGDGSLGLAEHAPYDGIVVTAGAPAVPVALKRQLKNGGRLVIPVGRRNREKLVRLIRTSDETFATDPLGPVSFVPLIGAEGWNG